MAKIQKPGGKPAATKIAPPRKSQGTKLPIPAVTSKPAPASVKPLQVKIPAILHQEIKLYALAQGISITELFLAMYKEYRDNHEIMKS